MQNVIIKMHNFFWNSRSPDLLFVISSPAADDRSEVDGSVVSMVSATSSSSRLLPPKERLREKAFQYCQRLIEQCDRSECVLTLHKPWNAVFCMCVSDLFLCTSVLSVQMYIFFVLEAQKKTDTDLQKAVRMK